MKQRIDHFFKELKLPVTRFCASIGITPQAYYRWRRGDLNLTDATLSRIDRYLTRYGF